METNDVPVAAEEPGITNEDHRQQENVNNIAVEPQEDDSKKIDLKQTIDKLKIHVDQVMSIRKSGENLEHIPQIYRNDMLPHILSLRHLYRTKKDALEGQVARVRDMNQKLVTLSLACDSASFEADCLNFEVVSDKNKLSPKKSNCLDRDGDVEMEDDTSRLRNGTSSHFDSEEVGRLDHETRTKLLNEEETKRKELQEKLAQLCKVTEKIEIICNESETQFSSIKPYMKQLVDAVRTSKLANSDIFTQLEDKSS